MNCENKYCINHNEDDENGNHCEDPQELPDTCPLSADPVLAELKALREAVNEMEFKPCKANGNYTYED